jgi:hypothetical protein
MNHSLMITEQHYGAKLPLSPNTSSVEGEEGVYQRPVASFGRFGGGWKGLWADSTGRFGESSLLSLLVLINQASVLPKKGELAVAVVLQTADWKGIFSMRRIIG